MMPQAQVSAAPVPSHLIAQFQVVSKPVVGRALVDFVGEFALCEMD
jgi:hypothetical protein